MDRSKKGRYVRGKITGHLVKKHRTIDYYVGFHNFYLGLRVTAFIRVSTPSVVIELSLRSSILRSTDCSTRTESVWIEGGEQGSERCKFSSKETT
jgi:hypothetical protein